MQRLANELFGDRVERVQCNAALKSRIGSQVQRMCIVYVTVFLKSGARITIDRERIKVQHKDCPLPDIQDVATAFELYHQLRNTPWLYFELYD